VIVLESRASVVLTRLLAGLDTRGVVLLPSNVCTAVPLACMAAGHGVEFVDIDPRTLEIDLADCEDRIRRDPQRHAALVFVRPYGALRDRAAQFARLRDVSPRLLVVDDRCLCPPACEAGSGADAVLYSTGARKHLDLGSGGYGLLGEGVRYAGAGEVAAGARADADMFALVREAVAAGTTLAAVEWDWPDATPSGVGLAAYFDDIRAALPAVAAGKQRLNAVYAASVPAGACLPDAYQHWRFNVIVHAPGALVQRLFDAGLFASRHYPDLSPLLGGAACPVAQRLAAHVVNLFNDRYYTEAMAMRTAELVRDHVLAHGAPEWVPEVAHG
jgi:hypothetical protein